MSSRIPEYVAPIAGLGIGVALGLGAASLIGGDEDYEVKRRNAIEECQYTLEDVPQQMTELPKACEDFAPYMAYNYAEGSYYVPAAGDFDDFIPGDQELYGQEIKDENDMFVFLPTLFGVTFGIIGLAYSMNLEHIRVGKERAEKAAA